MSQSLSSLAKEKNIKYFLVSFSDLHGISRAKLVPAAKIDSMLRSGAGFASFATYLDTSPADPDLFAFGDATSAIQLPWNPEVAWVPSNLVMHNAEIPQGPRNILCRLMEEYSRKGLTLKTGVEPEFFILSDGGDKISDKKDTLFKPCYDQQALMRRYRLISRISDYMEALGWHPYQSDHEDANGQFEMNWEYADALTTADRHSFFKFMVRSLAEEEGFHATFMPKPFSKLTGNGCHVHFSLWDDQGRNLFVNTEESLSEMAYHFLGGVLCHAEAMCAITNPTVNSYKRLHCRTPHSGSTWAPTTISYTDNNRTHMIRTPGSDRFELRLPDGAANPYLLQAVIAAAGFDGIENQMNPGKAVKNNSYESPRKAKELPQTLMMALKALEADKALHAYLGEAFIQKYCRSKRHEWGLYQAEVSEWERVTFLDI